MAIPGIEIAAFKAAGEDSLCGHDPRISGLVDPVSVREGVMTEPVSDLSFEIFQALAALSKELSACELMQFVIEQRINPA